MEMVNAVHRVDEQTSRRGHGDDPRGQKGDYNETILQRTVELYRQLNINIKEVMWFGEFRRITVPDGTDIKQLPNAIRRSLGKGELNKQEELDLKYGPEGITMDAPKSE
ncbi:hypothetical protein MMC14_008126 [Varicellaria rhodocarpa]|nr:hypothetical protein [Varicellaria rhodocarpa]